MRNELSGLFVRGLNRAYISRPFFFYDGVVAMAD